MARRVSIYSARPTRGATRANFLATTTPVAKLGKPKNKEKERRRPMEQTLEIERQQHNPVRAKSSDYSDTFCCGAVQSLLLSRGIDRAAAKQTRAPRAGGIPAPLIGW